MPDDIIDFATARAAKARKTTPNQPTPETDPVDRIAASVEKLAALTGKVAINLGALEAAVARNTADIALLKEGFATLTRMMRSSGGHDHAAN